MPLIAMTGGMADLSSGINFRLPCKLHVPSEEFQLDYPSERHHTSATLCGIWLRVS